jgi:hypothetical protein
LLSAALFAVLALALGLSAHRIRGRLIPGWSGAPALLVEAVLAIGLLIWTSELLGLFSALYAWSLIVLNLLLALGLGAVLGDRPEEPLRRRDGGSKAATGPAGPGAVSLLVMVAVIGLVVAHWGLTVDSALDRGMFNFDSLWYHMPFSADIASSHSVTGFHHTETVFSNWFYPQNSELLHAVGILIAERDTPSLFLNFGWLALAFLAAWTIGSPYGRGHLSVVAVAILLECHTLVVREPGAAKNDLAAAALVLAAIAILIVAWEARPDRDSRSLPPGWPLAAAGLAVGLAAGTKFTVLAMAAVLSLAVVALAPAGKRWGAAAWWFVPALLGGGYWYLRNLVAVGNPLPEIERLGPIALPHPEHLQTGRPDFTIAHYATDTRVWGDYFGPGLHDAFGALWPLVLIAAVASAVAALGWGRERVVRWAGGAALFGILAYLFTPLGAAGAEGAPTGFAINIRFVVPALLAALALLPLPRLFDERRRQAILLAALVVVLVLSDRSDAVLRDPSRVFGVALAILIVGIPAGLLWLRSRGLPGTAFAAGLAGLAIALVAIGYPLQRDYLEARFANRVVPEERIPGMDLDGAYAWAHDLEGARIGLAGTTAGFLGYGFYGTELDNEVVYLGEEGPHGSFDAIPGCDGFRAAVDAADLDYVVTSPFLNFIRTDDPVPSPEARWLRGSGGATPLLRDGDVTVWRLDGPVGKPCGPAQAPLREVPDAPVGE